MTFLYYDISKKKSSFIHFQPLKMKKKCISNAISRTIWKLANVASLVSKPINEKANIDRSYIFYSSALRGQNGILYCQHDKMYLHSYKKNAQMIMNYKTFLASVFFSKRLNSQDALYLLDLKLSCWMRVRFARA